MFFDDGDCVFVLVVVGVWEDVVEEFVVLLLFDVVYGYYFLVYEG